MLAGFEEEDSRFVRGRNSVLLQAENLKNYCRAISLLLLLISLELSKMIFVEEA